jgi:BolA protein
LSGKARENRSPTRGGIEQKQEERALSLANEIEAKLKQALPDAKLALRDTTGTNDHWELKIASDQFKGLSRVKRHQAIYKPLRELIDSNRVHALKIHAGTLEEWDHLG